MNLSLHIKKTIAGNSGQTLVEFALVALLFLALVFGVVEFGRYWYYSTHLGNSVRAAARYGAVLNPPSLIFDGAQGTTAYATAEIETYLPASGLGAVTTQVIGDDGVTPIDPNSTDTSGATQITPARGNTLMVTATYNFQVLTGTIIPGFNGIIPMTREASINVE
jgi:Flp pilus assembly protein TadG